MPLPIESCPITSDRAEKSRSSISMRLSISIALSFRCTPASVRVILFVLLKSCAPSSSSSSIICRDKVGWVICRTSAALEILSSLATARKYRNTRISKPSPSFLASNKLLSYLYYAKISSKATIYSTKQQNLSPYRLIAMFSAFSTPPTDTLPQAYNEMPYIASEA